MLARIQSLLPIGFPGEHNVFRHGEVVMFQKRVAEMRLHVLQPVLFHNGNQPRIVSVTIADVVLPTLVYVPSGGASHIQFPVIGIGDYIHALLSDSVFFQLCLVVLPNRLKLGVGKANSRCWRPCSLGHGRPVVLFLVARNRPPKSATEYCQKVLHAHDIDRECSLFHSPSV